VRTIEKGEAAKREIEASAERTNTVEVWRLDLSSYESVKAFAKQAENLPRLDAVIENAGVNATTFRLSENNESSITTNVISTFLLGLLLLPKLRESAQRFDIIPRLAVVASDVHFLATFAEKNQIHILDALADPKSDMGDRYAGRIPLADNKKLNQNG
jgi:retinol dehydrogenase 12